MDSQNHVEWQQVLFFAFLMAVNALSINHRNGSWFHCGSDFSVMRACVRVCVRACVIESLSKNNGYFSRNH